ncbi:MAG: c-type cytochrome, partial [Solirubrobacterales bacterium]
MKRPIVMFCVLAAICLVVLPFWALQSKGGADASPESSVPKSDQEGLELFQINCGACHTLEAAGTDGKIGPNLDQLLGTGNKSADTVKTNQERVKTAIENGIQG